MKLFKAKFGIKRVLSEGKAENYKGKVVAIHNLEEHGYDIERAFVSWIKREKKKPTSKRFIEFVRRETPEVMIMSPKDFKRLDKMADEFVGRTFDEFRNMFEKETSDGPEKSREAFNQIFGSSLDHLREALEKIQSKKAKDV